jgi:K+:H+ antiporter
MNAGDVVLLVLHVAAALAGVLALARLGGWVARRLRQPSVIGEIAAGLLAGPALVAIGGQATFQAVMPADVVAVLREFGLIGLVLFLVGVAHKLHGGPGRIQSRSVGWVVAGSFVPALLCGGVFAVWVLMAGPDEARGPAPAPAFLLFVALTLAVTAVPVLARILADRGMVDTRVGRLALSCAVINDTVAWLLLAIAIGLASGQLSGFIAAMVVLVVGVLAAYGIRRLLRSDPATRFCAGHPRIAAIILAVVAMVVATTAEQLGLTALFGAVIVGLAVPGKLAYSAPVELVSKAGKLLVPTFFVVTSVTVLAKPLGTTPWTLIGLACLLGVLGKIGGSYLGARIAGQPHWTAMQLGALMNTRGMTEIVILQVGYSVGILTPALFVSLVVMALVTTAMTGPLLTIIDRRTADDPEPALATGGVR